MRPKLMTRRSVLTLFSGSQAIATNPGWNTAPDADDQRAAGQKIGEVYVLDRKDRLEAATRTLPQPV